MSIRMLSFQSPPWYQAGSLGERSIMAGLPDGVGLSKILRGLPAAARISFSGKCR